MLSSIPSHPVLTPVPSPSLLSLVSPCLESARRRLSSHPGFAPTMRAFHTSDPPSRTSEPAFEPNLCASRYHDDRHGRRRRHSRPSDALNKPPSPSHICLAESWLVPLLPVAGRKRLRPKLPQFSATTAALSWLIVLLSVLLHPAAAASVSFENCLSESYLNNEPLPLQWVPKYVDASFEIADSKHTLRVTMWGNVTGSITKVALPPPGSSDWADKSKLDGKILDVPEPDSTDPKYTTLRNKVDFLTYEPWSQNTEFCNASLANASCPLAPVFNDDIR